MGKASFLVLASLMLLSGSSGLVRAERSDIRSALAVAPEAVYPQMFKMLQGSKWDALARAMDLLHPLLADTDKRLGEHFESQERAAIRSQNKKEVERLLLVIVGAGVKVLLMQLALEEDGVRRKQKLRQAFTEYLLIEPYLKQKDFSRTQVTVAEFRRAYILAVGEDAPFRASCEQIQLVMGETIPDLGDMQ